MIQDDNMCCGLTVVAFAVILSLVGIILIGVTILLIFYFKKKNQTE
jgi:LPXTG-motif cell wall-anchored protein